MWQGSLDLERGLSDSKVNVLTTLLLQYLIFTIPWGVVMHVVRLFYSQITEGITEATEMKALTVTDTH